MRLALEDSRTERDVAAHLLIVVHGKPADTQTTNRDNDSHREREREAHANA
jgi:hypothetical protein